MMKNGWKDIGAANAPMYYMLSGVRTLALSVCIVLKEDVDADVLQEAANETLKRFENWRRTLVSDGSNIYYIENQRPFIVAKDDGKGCHFCTDETNGYLCRIVYGKNTIRVDTHHGITDGKGFNEFLKTLLYYYFTKIGLDVDTQGIVLLNEGEADPGELEATYEKYGNANSKPSFVLEDKEAFRIPENELPQDEAKSISFSLSAPLDQVLSYAKSNGASVAPVLTDLIARTIRNIYDTKDSDVIGYLGADLRPYYGSKTIENFSMSFSLPISKELSEEPLEKRAHSLKELMKKQLAKENFDVRIAEQVDSFGAMRSMEGAFVDKAKELAGNFAVLKNLYTFLFTYIGKTNIPDSFLPYIERFKYLMPAFVLPVAISGTSLGNVLYLDIMQDFESDRFVQGLLAEFKASGIDAKVSEIGAFYGNTLLPSDIPIAE